MIEDRVDSEKDLTVHTCTGTITAEELLDAVKALYDEGPTPNHIWDMTGADVSGLAGTDLKQLAQFAKQYAPPRQGGRTAIVSETDHAFGLGRMYEAFSEFAGHQSQISVFRSLEEADAWIWSTQRE